MIIFFFKGELLMSNLEMLQKLSLGKNNTEKIIIETENGDKQEFIMRPLTDGELTKIQIIEKKPYNMKIKIGADGRKKSVEKPSTSDMDVGMGEFTESQAEAMYTAIAWSLSIDDEIVTVDDVKNTCVGIPELLFEQVIRISNLTEGDLTAIKSFRK